MTEGIPTNMIDCQRELDTYIKQQSGNDNEEGSITVETYETRLHTINLSDEITTCHGNATFTADDDEFGIHHFNISLGPRNSLLLIKFMEMLPPEPDEGDPPSGVARDEDGFPEVKP